MNPQRRNFIIAGAAVAIAALAPRLFGVARTKPGSDKDQLLARVLEALHHRPRAELPPVDDELVGPLLARILRAPVQDLDNYAALSAPALGQRIRHNIALDYQRRHLRVIEGWWLSQTEAGCLELMECATKCRACGV